MTATETMTELLAADQERKRIDSWRKYRTRVKDAATAGDKITAAQAGKLAEAAEAAGVEEAQIERHISAVRTHATHTTRLKELASEIPAAAAKRKTLIDELRSHDEKGRELRVAINVCNRPAAESSHLTESIRRIEFKHAKTGIFVREVA